MKKVHLLLAGMVFVLLAFIPAFGAEKKIELTFSSVYQDRHQLMQNCVLPWLAEIKEKTGGRLEIRHFTPGTLVPEGEIYDSVVKGSLDMGMTMAGRNPGKFPYTAAFDEPLIAPGSASASVALWNLYKDFPEIRKEFEETKVLTMYTSVPMQPVTKTPVKTLEDLAGKKMIITAAGSNQMAKALKTAPIMQGWPEVYMSLERGLADGVYGPIAQLRPYKVHEVCKSVFVVNLRVSSMYIVMNKKVWESLPDDIKKILEENTGEVLAARMGKTLDDSTHVDGQWMRERGLAFVVPSAAELQKWQNAVSPLREEWIKTAEGKGLKEARKIMDACIAYGNKYAELIKIRGYAGE